MDPNKEVIETEEITEPIEPSLEPSSSEPIEPNPGEPPAPEPGAEPEPGEPKTELEPEPGSEPEPEPIAGKTKETAEQKRENETQYWKRQTEKREKEVLELRQKLGAEEKQQQAIVQQRQQQIDQLYAQAAEYQQAGDFQTAVQLNRQAANLEAEMKFNQRLAPLQQTYYNTQYESIKRELAKDEDIINFSEIEDELDGIAKAFKINQPIALTSKEAIKNWALIVQGKRAKAMLKAAKDESLKRTQTNKKIIGEATIPSSKSAGAGNAGFTKEDKLFAEKHNRTLEDARKIRLMREKAQKEGKK